MLIESRPREIVFFCFMAVIVITYWMTPYIKNGGDDRLLRKLHLLLTLLFLKRSSLVSYTDDAF